MSNDAIPQYNGDPFPITREEYEQMKGSLALGRVWTKFNKGVQFELERAIAREGEGHHV